MENGQSFADEVSEIDAVIKPLQPVVLNLKQQMWIDYNAVGGLLTDDTQDWTDSDGRPTPMKKMTISEFATLIDVSRETLRNWRKSIPNFWVLVQQRRQEINGQGRLVRMHEKWYLNALKMQDWRISEAWFRNFDPNFVESRAKQNEAVLDNWADLLEAKRKQIQNDNTTKVIDATSTHTN